MDLLHLKGLNLVSPTVEKIDLPEFEQAGISADILRLDKIHPVISGNKWFKLKYYLEDALINNHHTLLTFGGAYSNHIVATAFAAASLGLKSIGIIRGSQPVRLSPTLESAMNYGMQLEFVSKASFLLQKDARDLTPLSIKYPDAYCIAEGGAGPLGEQGAAEILQWVNLENYTHLLCAIGTGTVLKGLYKGALKNQFVIGIPVLRGFASWLVNQPGMASAKQLSIFPDYHFGGYAKNNTELFAFMNQLFQHTGIPTDFVYTGKLLFATVDLAKKNYFPKNSKLLVIHGGGLQGNASLAKEKLIF